LARLSDIHLLSFVDHDAQLPAQESLRRFCASAQFFVRRTIPARNPSTLLPHAIREFADDEFAWALHRTIYLEQIDIVQLEYTVMSQYWGAYDHIPCFLFEHDVFFQSLLRRMRVAGFSRVGVLEYLRMLRYETRQVRRFSRVQVCSNENARYLVSFVPDMRGRIDSDTRAVIDSSKYEFVGSGREANTILFVGSFRHSPNLEGLTWFVENAFPSILQRDPSVQLVVVGSDPPDSMHDHPNIRILGFVDDVVVPLTRYAVFICPILSGSGLRVKLLEAFATGIPVVSTRIGAEGLAETPGDVCELADSADHFAQATLKLLNDPAYASAMAKRARVALEQQRDSQAATQRLVATYRLEVGRHRPHADTLARESLMAG
jgi:glycosyltransferase involved in cell wall biosynthesis